MSNKSIQFHNGKCMIARLAPTSPVSRLVTICCSLFAICLLLGTVPNSDAATWYTDTYLEFDKGAFDQTAIRSTSTTAFIELGRQGAAELSPDDKTVGLYHMNDGGASELSNSVQGSTVVALYHFNDSSPAALSADANTVALLHMDNDWNDSSGHGNNGTAYDGATFTTDARFGSHAGTFDGTDDYVSLPVPGVNIYSSFTQEAWIKTDTVNTDSVVRQYILTIQKNPPDDGYLTYMQRQGFMIAGDKINTQYWKGDGVANISSEAGSISANIWYHIGFTGGAEGGRLYINGALANSSTTVPSTSISVNESFIGRRGDANGEDRFNGCIDEVRISSCARTAAEICADGGGFADASGQENHGGPAISTMTRTTSMTGFGNCLEFNGVSDYVEISNMGASEDNLNTANFTLESWIKPNTVSPTWQGILTKKDPSGSSGEARGYQLHDNDLWGQISDGSNYYWVEADNIIVVDEWQHVVFTFNGTDAYLYRNGMEVKHETHTFTQATNNLPWTIGVDGGYGNNFNGLIDEVRISSGALTAKQIAEDAGTLVADGSSQDNFAVAVSTSGTSAGLSMWTDSGKFDRATTYDGTNDCVEVSTTATLNFAGDASWESWVKTSESGELLVVSKYKDTNNFYNMRIDNGIVKSSAVISAASVWNITGTEAINDNTFHHVAVTRADNDTVTLYVDGVSDGTSADTGADISLGGGKLYLGRSGNSADEDWFNGTIDEVRISSTAYSGNVIRYDALGACYANGDYVSDVRDTGANGTTYNNIYASTEAATSATLKFYVRSSSCTSPYVWTSWSGPHDSGDSLSGVMRYRYCQYKATFTTTNTIYSALMNDCTIQYSTNSASAPSLTSPDSSWNNSTPVFDWVFGDNEGDTQTAFRIQIATFSELAMTPPYGFAGTPKYDSGELSQSWSSYTWTSDIDDGIYWWQCKTQDSYGKWSVWSSTYQVKVDTIAPVNMTISWIRADDENQITVEGMGTDAGSGLHANAWWFEETTGNSGATSSSVWESTSVYTDSGLSRNTQYTYKVRLRDALGNVSAYSTPVTKWTLPAVWKENGTVRTGEKSFGTSSNSDWTWEIPVKGSQAVTVTAYIRYNSSYGSAALPKVILSNNGVNDSAQMSGGADVWEKVTVTGTPTADGVILLRFLAYSTNPGAEVFVDDIEVTQ